MPRVSVNIHCTMPHIESVAHILPKWDIPISDILPMGTIEKTLLITITPEHMPPDDTYPAAQSGDMVISRNAIDLALRGTKERYDSVILRINEQFTVKNGKDFVNWPYLTEQAASTLHSQFTHLRTNLPSIEKANSSGTT